MKTLKFLILSLLLTPFTFIFLVKSVYATQFKLFAPSGTLQRGQSYDFTIEIDTEGESLSQTQIGLTYDTRYLEFEDVTPGDTFSVISSQPAGDGKIIVTGQNDEDYSGTGTFAYAKLKIIAEAPGETEVCTLWAPTTTPEPTSPSSTPTPTSAQTKATGKKLPKTGEINSRLYSQVIGTLLVVSSITFIFVKKHKK